jgi:predicted transcriptional regulator
MADIVRFPTSHNTEDQLSIIASGVTSRDGAIIAQALITFIAVEQAKPDHEQQWSNLQDARAVFNAMWPEAAPYFDDTHLSLKDENAPHLRR